MKEIIYASLTLSVFTFASCTKNDVKTNVPAGNTQSSNSSVKKAGSTNPYVMMAKYTRDFIINDNNKYDCSTSGSNCNAGKSKTKKIMDQLAVLDSYIAQGNSGGYFRGSNAWQEIFPEITEAGINALVRNEIHIYKKPSVDETASYVLSSAQSDESVTADNVICVWQY